MQKKDKHHYHWWPTHLLVKAGSMISSIEYNSANEGTATNIRITAGIIELENLLQPTLQPNKKVVIKIKEILLLIFKIKSFFTEF